IQTHNPLVLFRLITDKYLWVTLRSEQGASVFMETHSGFQAGLFSIQARSTTAQYATHTHKHTRTTQHTPPQTQTQTHTHTHTHTHRHTHTHTHTHTHRHTHICAHTQTHTHT